MNGCRDPPRARPSRPVRGAGRAAREAVWAAGEAAAWAVVWVAVVAAAWVAWEAAWVRWAARQARHTAPRENPGCLPGIGDRGVETG